MLNQNIKFAPATLVFLSMVAALALQHALGWVPCPLCILQRLSAIGLMLSLAAWALAKDSRSQKIGLGVGLLMCLLGLAAGTAHLWVLAHPTGGACAPGISRLVGQLMDYIPGSAWLLEGAGSCETADYKVAGVPLPALSMLAHVVPFLVALSVAKVRMR